MKSNRMMWVLVVLVVLTTMAITFGTRDSRSQEKAANQIQPTPVNPINELKKDYPRVDYYDNRPISPERQKRSEKYGKHTVLNPNAEGDSISTSFVDWETGMSVLPVKESDIIVIGKVTNAQAYLSSNKESVYSEFTIEIERQFKNISPGLDRENKYLEVERDGGIVHYPSGYETFYFVDGQRMPKVSKRYLFFLTSKFPLYGYKKGDLYLITAYELSNEKVTPLDNPGGGTHKIATFYRDKDETILLNDLSKKLGVQI